MVGRAVTGQPEDVAAPTSPSRKTMAIVAYDAFFFFFFLNEVHVGPLYLFVYDDSNINI